jgi:hypothetical protein
MGLSLKKIANHSTSDSTTDEDANISSTTDVAVVDIIELDLHRISLTT